MEASLPLAAPVRGRNAPRKRGNGRRVLGAISGDHVLAWADQAVVSATSFVALVMIARWSDASQLGTYAVGGSLLALLLATQDSLITRPYVIQMHQPLVAPREHAFGSLMLSLVLSVVTLFALAACALLLLVFDGGLAAVVGALAAFVPFALIREFARRFSFAHLRVSQALLLDIAVATLNIALLAWLGLSGRLSAAAAFGAAGLSCGIGALGWLYLARNAFAPCLGQIRTTLKQSMGLGKWLLSSQMIIQVQGYSTHWLSLIIGGAIVTGIYAACMSIVAFANPFLFGFYNILMPKSVRVLKDGGAGALRKQAIRDSLFLAATMGVFCVCVFAFGEALMHFLYAAGEYRGNGHTLTVLALATLAAAIGAPASIALAAAEQARTVAFVTAGATLLNIALVWALMTEWGLVGAAYGILAAEIAGSIGRWIAFLRSVPSSGTPQRRSPAGALP